MSASFDPTAEWLETDGFGGFAMGTADDVRTRRYHALLVHAAKPPAERRVLVNAVEAWLEHEGESWPLGSQRYAPDVLHPRGAERITAFVHEPWPRWTIAPAAGVTVEHERFMRHGLPLVSLRWRVSGAPTGTRLRVRPLLSGRDLHATHRENPAFRFGAERDGDLVAWRPYDGVPGVLAFADGEYEHAPDWWRRFQYDEERSRGLDFTEDLASPGVFRWDLSDGEAVLTLAADEPATRALLAGSRPRTLARRLRAAESRRRAAFPSPLHRAADAYVVSRGRGLTVIAGYPWFGDWGRDTFIALRGLCLATGRLDDARRILVEWAGAVSEGMLPNRFPDAGDVPEYNSVDASLWYVVVVGEWLHAMRDAGRAVAAADLRRVREAVAAILAGYASGTRHGIHAAADGLLAAGEPGVQLTWMDAKIGDWVVTPRVGKPVEVQALWVNALDVGARFDRAWAGMAARARAAFVARFWDDARGTLADVVDVDHVPGTVDATLRPNQLLAIGGLPAALLEGPRARRALEAIERELWTPMGPRSLAPGSAGYVPQYSGGVFERDSAYHQGTVWPWLVGPFVDAWLRVHGEGDAQRAEARRRFVEPLFAHVERSGLGHVSEIADADAPHQPNGCPFQAWSVGELLRLESGRLAPAQAAMG